MKRVQVTYSNGETETYVSAKADTATEMLAYYRELIARGDQGWGVYPVEASGR